MNQSPVRLAFIQRLSDSAYLPKSRRAAERQDARASYLAAQGKQPVESPAKQVWTLALPLSSNPFAARINA